MTEAAVTGAATLARLAHRLHGTAPRHAREHWRLGATLVTEHEAGLRELVPAAPVPAAVLVGLIDHADEPSVLLTVRAADLRRHGGQIAFPGGVMEVADASAAATALREAHEEVGLRADDVTVLGFLPDHVVLTGYRVTPVVARLPPGVPLRLDAREVADTFELPWSVVADGAGHVLSERLFGGVRVPTREIWFAGRRIWGLTAAILMLLREWGTTG